MAVVIYIRVSTEEQAESGLGLEAQEHACRAWAERHAADVAGVYRDDCCSVVPPADRRGLSDALAALSKGDVLLVLRRDRVARDTFYSCIVERAALAVGARLVSTAGEGTDDDSPTSILMRRIFDAFAEYERLLIKARTKAAMQAKKRRGEFCGGRLPSWVQVVDGKAVYPSAVRAIIGHSERASLRDTADVLAAMGYCRVDGRPLCPSSIAVLRRRILGG